MARCPAGALTLSLISIVPPSAEPRGLGAPGPAVELLLAGPAGLDHETLLVAEATTRSLLATAGVSISWRDCSAGACPPISLRTVPLHLMPFSRLTDPKVCGDVLRDPETGAPTILVYVKAIDALHREIVGSGHGRAQAVLATLHRGHLVGLTIAHELGHALGLPHTRRGIMNARPTLREVLQLRQSTLAFDRREAAAMRLTLSRVPETLARDRWPAFGNGIGEGKPAANVPSSPKASTGKPAVDILTGSSPRLLGCYARPPTTQATRVTSMRQVQLALTVRLCG